MTIAPLHVVAGAVALLSGALAVMAFWLVRVRSRPRPFAASP